MLNIKKRAFPYRLLHKAVRGEDDQDFEEKPRYDMSMLIL